MSVFLYIYIYIYIYDKDMHAVLDKFLAAYETEGKYFSVRTHQKTANNKFIFYYIIRQKA